MLKFDFKTYVDSFISKEELRKYSKEKENYIKKLSNCEMTGWTNPIDKELIADIKSTANYIKKNFVCCVVIGSGG